MASICFYFQVHQPKRLSRYSIFDSGQNYFDDGQNRQIIKKIADKCYRPALDLLIKLVHRYQGELKLTFSITGTATEQLQQHAPDVIERLAQLVKTSNVELLSETYHHSLASLYSLEEFDTQLAMHRKMIRELFEYTPRVFRNTELIYNNDLANHVATLNSYIGVIAEGVDSVLNGRSANTVYRPETSASNNHAQGSGSGQKNHTHKLGLLLKNYRLSDDIAFRFSDHSWSSWPLTPEKFANSISKQRDAGELCNLFMDFETFGEHQWKETGIFDFLENLPEALLNGGHDFKTPSELLSSCAQVDNTYDCPDATSWADSERDLSAWAGNAMQKSALENLYDLESSAKASADAQILGAWRNLSTSDHFYYMSTKHMADQNVHNYFNPYPSPYDAYINFMNVLDNLRGRCG